MSVDLGTIFSDVELRTGKLKKGETEATGIFSRIGRKAGGMSKAIKMAAIGGGIAFVGLGLAALKLGGQFDEIYDKIRVGTGATGEDLKGLKDDFKYVFSAIPVDMSAAGQAISDFNTLTGATGPILRDMSVAALEAARMLGEDSAALIAGASRAFNVFEIANEDAAGALDVLFAASQATNIPMTQLATTMQTYGPVLKNLNLSFEESTALFSALYKGGVDVSRVMPGLNAYMRKLADEGVTDLYGGLKDVVAEVKEATTESEALNIATVAFGAEGAQRLSVAIRTGVFDLEEYTAQLEASGGVIMDTSEATISWTQKLEVLKNKALVKLEPVLIRIFDGLTAFFTIIEKKVLPVLSTFSKYLGFVWAEGDELNDWLTNLPPSIQPIALWIGKATIAFQELIPQIIDAAKEIGLFLLPALDTLTDLWSNLWPVLQDYVIPALQRVGAFIMEHKPLLILVVAAILALVAPWLAVVAAIALVLAKWDEISGFFASVANQVKGFINTFREIPIIGGIFEGAFKAIWIIVEYWFNTIKNYIETVIGAIKNIITIVMALIKGDWEGAWQGVKDLVTGIWDGIKKQIELVLKAIQGLIGVYLDTFLGVIKDGWALIKDFFIKTIPNWFKTHWKEALIVIFAGIPGLLIYKFRDKIIEAFNEVKEIVTSTVSNFFRDHWKDVLIGVIGGIPILLMYTFRDKLKDAIVTIGDSLKQKGTSVANWVWEGIKSLPGKMLQLGIDIVEGLWDGIASMKTWLLDKVKGLGGAVLGAVGDGLGKLNPFSPSVFGIEVGEGLGLGIEKGIASTLPTVESAGRSIAESIEDSLFRYTKFTVKYSDHLNDWLTHLPEGLQRPAEALGEAIVNDSTGAVADALEKYITSTGSLGDYLNDYLTHLPDDLRSAAKQIGIAIVEEAESGLVSGIDSQTATVQDSLSKFLEACLNGLQVPKGWKGIRWTETLQGFIDEAHKIAATGGVDAAVAYIKQFTDLLDYNEEPATKALRALLGEVQTVGKAEGAEAGMVSGKALLGGLLKGTEVHMPSVIKLTQSIFEAYIAAIGGPAALSKMGKAGQAWVGYMGSWLGAIRNVASQGGIDAAIDYIESLIDMLGDQSGPAKTALSLLMGQLSLLGQEEGSEAGEVAGGAVTEGLGSEVDQTAPGTAQEASGAIGAALGRWAGSSTAGAWGRSIGGYVMSGIWQAFNSDWDSWAESIADIIYDGLIDALGISSPAKKAIPLGVAIGAGIQRGINLEPLSIDLPKLNGMIGGTRGLAAAGSVNSSKQYTFNINVDVAGVEGGEAIGDSIAESVRVTVEEILDEVEVVEPTLGT